MFATQEYVEVICAEAGELQITQEYVEVIAAYP
jgi:hypothetical protein